MPPKAKTSAWLSLVKETFLEGNSTKTEPIYIAVHCLAGLGRAPVLVGIALIEYGLESNEAISLIRKNRPGALNSQQVRLLTNYRRSRAFSNASCCLVF